jgi:phage shock protein C
VSGRLERSRTNRVIGGVCGGLAEYLDIDATIVRVGMVILGSFGIGILIYFVLLVLMPNPGEATPFVRPGNGDPAASAAVAAAAPARVVGPNELDRRRSTLGILLVAVGVIFMLGNVGAFRFIEWRVIWPLVLIALGVFFISQRARS